MKVLVICGNLFNQATKNGKKISVVDEDVRHINEILYFIGDENRKNFENVERMIKNLGLNLILIHSGPNNGYYTRIKSQKFNVTIIGFHTQDDIYKKIEGVINDNNKLNEFIEWIKKKIEETRSNNLLSLFLPLDIDMQALGEIKDDQKRIKYMADMFEGFDGCYEDKYTEACNIINSNEDLKKNQNITQHIKEIRGLLQELDKKKENFANQKSLSLENIKEILNYEINGYGNFHAWYKGLVELF
jgi:hypothetical protein